MPLTEERCETFAKFMIKQKATVRRTASEFGISKSTVHKDVTVRLKEVNRGLYGEIKELLDQNKKERHLRGGKATKEKYERLKELRKCVK